MSLYLVTGGAGFIGSNLCATLVQAGHSVRVLDDLSAGNLDNLYAVRESIEFVQGDVRDTLLVRQVMKGVDYVVHLAAIASAPLSVSDPVGTTSVNVLGTSVVLNEARLMGVRRLVFAASAAAYGARTEPAKSEDLIPDPQSPYAIHKIMGESMCRVFSHLYGLPTVSLRFFNIYGPNQNPESGYAAAIPRFIARYMALEAPVIEGDGLQTRDFCHIKDLSRAIVLAATSDRVGHGEVINIGTGESVTILDITRVLGEIFGSNLSPVFAPQRPGDVRHSRADVTLARELLGFTPSVSLTEGLRSTVSWFCRKSGTALA